MKLLKNNNTANKILFFLEKYIGAFFIYVLGQTLQIRVFGEIPSGNVIYAFWHRNMIPLLFFRRNEGVVIMISSSKDGELISGPAEALGFQSARGSSTRGGSSAIKMMIKMSKENSLAITPDGPKGPDRKIKPGIILLAYFTKIPIIPVAVDIKSEFVFNSWDRFRLPKLFSRINIRYGEPIAVNSKKDFESKQKILQKSMEDLEKINKIK
ncbi:MAG: lysophospholipid acyltransferase family protein [Candidatus Cloacimonetes bacterium]|nr:lysophospholipid acyltransferase family protein [Candidatus Cloacimonadota bacterium]